MKKHWRQTLRLWKSAALEPLSLKLDPEAPGVVVACVIRNEGWRLPCFLRHYRKLGVRRFVFIDNDSADDSRDFLAGQEDVDLYACAEQFSVPGQRAWMHKAMARYGFEGWRLCLDADELLVYDGMEEHSLEELARLLQKIGNLRPLCMLVDMYGAGGLAELKELDSCEKVLERCRYFDASGYTEFCSKHRVRFMGGVRGRMYAQMGYTQYSPELTKYPLFYLSRGDMMIGPHQMYPAWRNFLSERILGLLHYKFSRFDLDKIQDALERRIHWNNSEEYQRYDQWFRERPGSGFLYEDSREFLSSQSLVGAGLLKPIDWSGASTHMLDWRKKESWLDPKKRERLKHMIKDLLCGGWRKKDFLQELEKL